MKAATLNIKTVNENNCMCIQWRIQSVLRETFFRRGFGGGCDAPNGSDKLLFGDLLLLKI